MDSDWQEKPSCWDLIRSGVGQQLEDGGESSQPSWALLAGRKTASPHRIVDSSSRCEDELELTAVSAYIMSANCPHLEALSDSQASGKRLQTANVFSFLTP